jgi:hypothetical protein
VLREHGQLSVDESCLATTAFYEAGLTSHASVMMLALEDRFDVEFPERCCGAVRCDDRRDSFRSVRAVGTGVMLAVASGEARHRPHHCRVDLRTAVMRSIAKAAFPRSLRRSVPEGLLARMPTELGGGRLDCGTAAACESWTSASTAMVSRCTRSRSCLVRHTRTSDFFRDFLTDVARNGRLMHRRRPRSASVATCAAARRDRTDGSTVRVRKQAPVVSYGDEPGMSPTARRAPDAAASTRCPRRRAVAADRTSSRCARHARDPKRRLHH